MPKSNSKHKSKLHCQFCGKLRQPMKFWGIVPEQKDDESNVYPFKIKKFLELLETDTKYKFPSHYAAMCNVCARVTFYGGTKDGKKLVVIPT